MSKNDIKYFLPNLVRGMQKAIWIISLTQPPHTHQTQKR